MHKWLSLVSNGAKLERNKIMHANGLGRLGDVDDKRRNKFAKQRIVSKIHSAVVVNLNAQQKPLNAQENILVI